MPMSIFGSFAGSQYYADLTLAGVGSLFSGITTELESVLDLLKDAATELDSSITTVAMDKPSGLDTLTLSRLDASSSNIDTTFSAPSVPSSPSRSAILSDAQRAALARYATDAVHAAPAAGEMAARHAAAANGIGLWSPGYGELLESAGTSQISDTLKTSIDRAIQDGTEIRGDISKSISFESSAFQSHLESEAERQKWESMRYDAALKQWGVKQESANGWVALAYEKSLKVNHHMAAIPLGIIQSFAQICNVGVRGSGEHSVSD